MVSRPYREMLFARRLIGLLGAEYQLLREAGLLRRFYACALLIVATMACTWIGIEYAINLLFHTTFAEIGLAVFFSLLFACMYIFLLNTFSKEQNSGNRWKSISNAIRTCFVAFMGFLIAQPLLVLVYAKSLTHEANAYKEKLTHSHFAKIDTLASTEWKKLTLEKQRLEAQGIISTSHRRNLQRIDSLGNSLQQKTDLLKQSAAATIQKSDFFLFRVERVNRHHPMAWLATVVIVAIFLLPGYLVYTISGQHDYYQAKKEREKKLVLAAYHRFAAKWSSLFAEPTAIFSRFEDPPFNQQRKQPTLPAPLTDFLHKYINNP